MEQELDLLGKVKLEQCLSLEFSGLGFYRLLGGLSGRISSGSLMIPRPISKDCTRTLVRRKPHTRTIGKNRRFLFVTRCSGKIPANDLLFPFPRWLIADLRKEHRHPGQFLFRPIVRPLTHERQSHGMGNRSGIRALNRSAGVRLF